MRILLTDFHRGWGGQANQVLMLAKQLQQDGNAVLVMAPPDSELLKRIEGTNVSANNTCNFTRGFRPVSFCKDYFAFKKVIREWKPDIIHTHGSQDNWLAVIARGCCKKVPPIVRTKHNSFPIKKHFFNRYLMTKLNQHVIAVAETIRKDLLQIMHPDSCTTIHAGFDDSFKCFEQNEARISVRNEFNLHENAVLIGLVGRFMPEKGQHILIQSLKKIQESIPEARLLLVGTGGYYNETIDYAKSLKLKNYCIFTGQRDDIARLTAACDVSVLAAISCDASSTVLKEAMSVCVPVVGTDVGGTSEILEYGKCGIVIPPNDSAALAEAIIQTLKERNTEKGEERIQYAYKRVNQMYRMREIVKRTVSIYSNQ